MSKAEQAVLAILDQGDDPVKFRKGLAEHAGVAVEVIDAIIERSGSPRDVHPDVVADEIRHTPGYGAGTGLNTYDE